ncbi:hypothetical protein AXF42_Ash005842 [Apostasia shenzhenica]|uniref:Uncharacterized protein n=1 Tax=Apostasia shenzhenica TaxID=1088818 RepID=A0A2I0BCJ3_9ASPA|nr:hypothetical protein AXF42_Ash005842 [Apostasia shenzhenica]
MPDLIRSCFAPPASTAVGPSLTTSIYDTHLGLASLSWSRTVLGLSLRVDLRLSHFIGYGAEKEEEEEILRLRIRPWLLWKRKGLRRFRHKIGLCDGAIDIGWDLSRARFVTGGGPEPSSGFFAAVAVDGEMVLVAGDMEEEANRKMKARMRPHALALLSRTEHVMLTADAGYARGKTLYRTAVIVAGRERGIAIEISGHEESAAGMCVAIDGEKVLQVRRLRWKFRGSERVDIGGGIQISWDLHSWLFPSKANRLPPVSVAGAAAAEMGQAVFIFRFENREEGGSMKKGKIFASGAQGAAGTAEGRGAGSLYRGLISGHLGTNLNWSESGSGGGGSVGGGERRKRTKKSLLKTSSSSSSSSASSAGSSSVMDWASPEETELRGFDGFTLVVYAWKS